MSRYAQKLLHVVVSDGVATATIHHAHPACVMTRELFRDLRSFVQEVADDPDVRVLVLRSADPDFFIAHFDVGLILQFPTDAPATRSDALGSFHVMTETLRTMNKPTIAVIEGRVGGGGNELCAACDMRFGLEGATVINQMEVPLGILPGGSGTVNIPKLIGRGRALELILSGTDLDARTAEQWGYLNRVFPSRDALAAHVQTLARRMAQFPPSAVARAKQSVLNAVSGMPQKEALLEEAHLFQQTFRQPESRILMQAFMDAKATGGQTRDGERRVGQLAPYLSFGAWQRRRRMQQAGVGGRGGKNKEEEEARRSKL